MKQHLNFSNVSMGFLAQVFACLLLPAILVAGEVTLAWDPNAESNLAGYKLYYDGDTDTEMYQGTGADAGDSPVVIYLENLTDPDSPVFTLTGLTDGQYYYFVLTAFDTDGMESDYSDEVGTLVESDDTASSTSEASSETSDTSSETVGSSGGSGGGCFISNATGSPVTSGTTAAALLLMAAAGVMHLVLTRETVTARRRRGANVSRAGQL